jgi:hypothetical protein
MPNWCDNLVTLRHEDPAQIARAVDAFRRGEFLAELVPNPDGEWDYDWSIKNWGTKWDVGGNGCEPVVSDNGRSASFHFESAWSPPTVAYDRMQDLGFSVHAYYYEPGMAFCGIYDECGDDCYNLEGMDSGDVAQQIPQELDLCFEISATMAEYEDEEPLTKWYQDGVEAANLDPHDPTPHEFSTAGRFVIEEGLKK